LGNALILQPTRIKGREEHNTCKESLLHHSNEASAEQAEEGNAIPPPDARPEPRAVMIEVCDAVIARAAVMVVSFLFDIASGAKLQCIATAVADTVAACSGRSYLLMIHLNCIHPSLLH
jgi:hypothetical protein